MEFTSEMLLTAVVWYVAFLFSTTVHEAAHALVAWKLGDPTAYEGGQVTLNPGPHIQREPFGMVVIPLVLLLMSGGRMLMGWGAAPYDPRWAANYPRRSAWMALAGPASNVLLLLISVGLIHLALSTEFVRLPAPSEFGYSAIVVGGEHELARPFAMVVSVMFAINLLLIVLNMLPFPPLDGSAAIILFMNDSTAGKYQDFMTNMGAYSAVGLLVAIIIFRQIFAPIFIFAFDTLIY